MMSNTKKEAKVLIAGDYCLTGRATKMSVEELDMSFCEVKKVVSEADYAMVNLECAVFENAQEPIKKIGPNLHCDNKALQNLKDVGFRCLALANNHFADFGDDAVKESLSMIDSFGFDRVGAGMDVNQAQQTLYVEVNGIRLAVINCCEHEFTTAETSKAGCNPLDVIDQYNAIIDARKQADFVLMLIHGGSEHYQLPTPRMQQTYRFFLEVGADVVVNCHQHCYSGYERYQGKMIFYGLGNFFFDSVREKNRSWNEGYMLTLSFSDDVSFEIIPYAQCTDKIGVRLFSMEEKRQFGSKIDELNATILNKSVLAESFSKWISAHANDYYWVFRLPVSKWEKRFHKIRAIIKKDDEDLCDSFLTQPRVLTLLSYARCESHRDVFVELLKRMVK